MRLVSNLALATAALATAMVSSAGAVTVVNQTYSGTFPATINGTLPSADTALEESFTLPTDSNFWAATSSYATGGFKPTLTLYSATGLYEGSNGATPPPGGVAGDSYLMSNGPLTAGNYILMLNDATVVPVPNAPNPADLSANGFVCSANGTGTDAGSACSFGSSVNGTAATGAYALSLTVAPVGGTGGGVSSTPEPATVLLLVPAFGLLYFMRKRISVN